MKEQILLREFKTAFNEVSINIITENIVATYEDVGFWDNKNFNADQIYDMMIYDNKLSEWIYFPTKEEILVHFPNFVFCKYKIRENNNS